jgi:hypothetical protein
MPGEPTIDQVHIDAAVSDLVVQKLFYANNFIANRIFPPVPVDKQSDKYFIVDPREGKTDEHEEELIYGQPATEMNFVIDKGQYYCKLHGKRHLLPDGLRFNADAAIADYLKGDMLLIENMAIRRERDAWAYLTESDTYPSSDHWFNAEAYWDALTAIPKHDIDKAIRVVEMACGVTANTLVLPPIMFDALTSNADVKDLIKYRMGPEYFATGSVGDIVYNLRLVRAAATFDSAAPLETSNIQFIWENANSDAGANWAWVGYVDPNPARYTSGFGAQFIWKMNSAAPGLMARMRVYRDEPREGEWHEIRADWDMVVTNNRAGCMIVNCLAGS